MPPDFSAMQKAQIAEWARANLGVAIGTDMTKEQMIAAVEGEIATRAAAAAASEPPATLTVTITKAPASPVPLMVNGRLIEVPTGVATTIPRSHFGALVDSGAKFTVGDT